MHVGLWAHVSGARFVAHENADKGAPAKGASRTRARGMMPDLGKYAVEVTSAYIVSLVLIGMLVWLSWRKSKQVRLALEALEADLRKRTSR